MREFEPLPLYQELHLPPPPPKPVETKKEEERGVVIIDLGADDEN